MDKYQLVSHLAAIISIMASQDAAGAMNRSQTLAREYERSYSQLKELLKKEDDNEARKSNEQQSGRSETRTDQSRR